MLVGIGEHRIDLRIGLDNVLERGQRGVGAVIALAGGHDLDIGMLAQHRYERVIAQVVEGKLQLADHHDHIAWILVGAEFDDLFGLGGSAGNRVGGDRRGEAGHLRGHDREVRPDGEQHRGDQQAGAGGFLEGGGNAHRVIGRHDNAVKAAAGNDVLDLGILRCGVELAVKHFHLDIARRGSRRLHALPGRVIIAVLAGGREEGQADGILGHGGLRNEGGCEQRCGNQLGILHCLLHRRLETY